MGTYTFTLDGLTHTIKTVLESETRFFVAPNNKDVDIDAFIQYRNELESEAFQNQPPQTFKFYYLRYVDETERTVEDLVGADNLEKAVADLCRANSLKKEQVQVVSSYEKFCNFAALTDEEAMAQYYGHL